MAEGQPATIGGASGLVPIETLAKLLMVTPAWIRMLQSRGFIPKSGKKNLVSLTGGVQGYINFLKDEDRNSSRKNAENAVRTARAEEIRLRIAERARTLCDVAEACECLDEITTMVISELDGMPARFTRDLSLRRQLQKQVDDIRDRLSTRLDEKIVLLRTGSEGPSHQAAADA